MYKKLAYYLIITIFTIIFTFKFFFASIPFNAQTPNYFITNLFNRTLPQGWGFFTKSPRDPLYDIFKVENNNLEKINIKNTEGANLYGISRLSRKYNMEVSIITAIVKDSVWNECKNLNKIQVPKKIYTIDNSNLEYLKNGKYLLVKRKLIPWAWIDITNNTQLEYESIYVQPN